MAIMKYCPCPLPRSRDGGWRALRVCPDVLRNEFGMLNHYEAPSLTWLRTVRSHLRGFLDP